MTQLTKDKFPKYTSNSYKSIPEKQTTQSNTRKKSWRDISPKKTYRWLTNTWKDAQHHSLLEKCKSKPQWNITSHWSEWPSSKSLQTINAGEAMEKRKPSRTVGRNVKKQNISRACPLPSRQWHFWLLSP